MSKPYSGVGRLSKWSPRAKRARKPVHVEALVTKLAVEALVGGVLPRLAWGDEGALDARAAQPAEHRRPRPDWVRSAGAAEAGSPRGAFGAVSWGLEAPPSSTVDALAPGSSPCRHGRAGCAHAGSPSADTAPSTRACVRPQARLWRPASIRSETTSERRSEARMRADMKRPAPGRTPPARGVSTRSPPVSIWRHGLEQGVTASEQRTGWRQNSGPDDAWAVG
jgi:hypothetical protein